MNQVSILQAMYSNHHKYHKCYCGFDPVLLSREAAMKLVARKKSIASHALCIKSSGDSEKRVVFYNDNHMFGYKLDFTTSKNQSTKYEVSHTVITSYFPQQVTPREECPTGMIEDFETYEKVFDKDIKTLWNISELLEELGFDNVGNVIRFKVGDKCN
jgi:hypothetical protein